MFNKIYNEDCITGLAKLPDGSIDCCVTSPPYWGLRDYGCDEQIGLEETPEEYVSKMVSVFREVKRVLKPEGTLWLNLGDSYAGSGGAGYQFGDPKKPRISHFSNPNLKVDGCKPKDLVGIPWMVAFALRSNGWYLRQDIIWHKPNPMPESVTDRCTKSHEYVFLLSKSSSYYFDSEAIAEPTTTQDNTNRNRDRTRLNKVPGRIRMAGLKTNNYETRNKRSVWTVNTKPFAEAHFATYPEELIEPCILAGCPEEGIVLDPFMGSGTTAVVAVKNNRQYVGFELNNDYIKIAEKRISVAVHNKKMDDSQITVFDLKQSATSV